MGEEESRGFGWTSEDNLIILILPNVMTILTFEAIWIDLICKMLWYSWKKLPHEDHFMKTLSSSEILNVYEKSIPSIAFIQWQKTLNTLALSFWACSSEKLVLTWGNVRLWPWIPKSVSLNKGWKMWLNRIRGSSLGHMGYNRDHGGSTI